MNASTLRYYNPRMIAVVLTASCLLLVMWLSFSLLSAISRRLDATMTHFSKIAQGNYNTLIEIKGRDEVSKVMAALKSMQIKLGFNVAEAKRIADENLHIKIALDNVSTGVILADNDRNIIYVNKSVVSMFNRAEAEIRKQMPNFSVVNLVGTNLDLFHKAFKHQLLRANSLIGSRTVNVDLIGSSMEVVATPVITSEGKSIGSVAITVEQTAGIEQVNLSLGQMDHVTQQNAALVKQAAAAQSLEEQTQHLTVTVAHFKTNGDTCLADA